MVLLFTLFVGGVLWTVSLQTSLEPVGNRRIFGVLAASLYVVGFCFVWLTALTWCAVERRRAAHGDGGAAGGAALPVHEVITPGALWRTGWWWQALCILVVLWLGTGSVSPGAGLVGGRGVLKMLVALGGLGLLGYLVLRADLPQRLGRWLTPLVPLVVGGVLYLVLNHLIDWVDMSPLVARLNDNVLSMGVFLVVASFVALLLGAILRRRGGEVPLGAERHDQPPPSPADMGWALAPMLAPVVAFACMHYIPPEQSWERAVASHGQVGLTFHAMLLPLFPAALIVAWGLDRRDGSTGSPVVPALAVVALVFIVLWGPELLRSLHPRPDAPPGLGEATSDPFWNWDPAAGSWARLPVDGLVRGAAAMLLCVAGLSATFLTRLGREGRGASIPALLMLLALQVLLSFVLQPQLGPLGAALAAAIAAATVWCYEVFTGDVTEPVPA